MAYPPLSVGTDFTDDTPAVGVHADRHNVTAAAVNEVVGELGPNPKGTFEHVDDRLTGIEGDVDTLRDLVLPPDPGALSDMTSFTVSSPIPDHVYFDFAASGEPSMQGGFGHYVVELSMSSSFTSPSQISFLTPRFVPFPGYLLGSAAPPLYFRIKAVDYYGNESAWLVHGASPPTPDPVTVNTRDLDDLDITAADIRTLIKSPVPLFSLYADISTTHTDGTFDDLQSVTIPAGQLAANGDRLVARWVGAPVAHATATRQVRAVFGGTTVVDTTAYATTVGGVYVWDLEILRVSSSVVRASVNGNNPTYSALSPLPFAGASYTEVTGLTLANTQVLKITAAAAGTGAASGDITGRSLTVSYHPAP